MDTFDWNNDGKHDWQDDVVFLEILDQEASNSHNQTDFLSNHRSADSEQLGICAKVVIAGSIILCIAALFMGYFEAIGSIIELGGLLCLLMMWLES